MRCTFDGAATTRCLSRLRELGYAVDRMIPVVIRPTRKLPWILEQLQMVPLNKNIERAAQKILKRLEQGPERVSGSPPCLVRAVRGGL